ncbi:MAG: TMEM165/GDT1 family protein [Candidatus Omnitrophica bacterium]|nr:TMEM165/GDT1 family protein [Candidatus Omnitrophota bacterium]
MDWTIFLATFSAIFLAGLTDKTRLVGIDVSAKSRKPLSVWIGSILACIYAHLVRRSISLFNNSGHIPLKLN